jgi:hypothetical protein
MQMGGVCSLIVCVFRNYFHPAGAGMLPARLKVEQSEHGEGMCISHCEGVFPEATSLSTLGFPLLSLAKQML